MDALADNPLLNSRRHPDKNIRWRYPDHFPYRVIYEIRDTERKVLLFFTLPAKTDIGRIGSSLHTPGRILL